MINLKKMMIASLVLVGFCMLPLNSVQAETIEEVEAQVNAYISSGDIADVDYGNALLDILFLARVVRDAGDTASSADFLSAFDTSVNEAVGVSVTSEAASTLIDMTP